MNELERFLEEDARPEGLAPIQSDGTYGGIKVFKRKQFDSLGDLIDVSKKLSSEIEYQEKVRSGTVKELRLDGKERAFRAENLLGAYGLKIQATRELIKYQYAKAPEKEETPKGKSKKFVIQLTRGDDDVFEIEPMETDGKTT